MPFKSLIINLLFVFLATLLSCKNTRTLNLYKKGHPRYQRLSEEAALQCVKDHKVFENLREKSFKKDFTEGAVYKIKENSYIVINDISDDGQTVIFSMTNETNNANLYTSFLNDNTFSITIDKNNEIVDMIAKGICSKTFKGDPSKSDTSLSFTVDRYYIKDSTEVLSDKKPKQHTRRYDQFQISQDVPVFLFIWTGKYQTYKRAEDDSSDQETSIVELDLELTSLPDGCPSGINCSAGAANPLSIDTEAYSYSKLRSKTNDDFLKDYYYQTSF